MTIKEIAELCGVDERTVYRWVEAGDKMSPGLKQKFEKSGHGVSADFTLGETLVIIRDGGKNKTLAALLAENAANKNALAISPQPLKPSIDPFSELSTARLHELRMCIRELRKDLEEERISVREFRRLAFNFDTPDVPDNPIKGALVFKTHDDFIEYAETHTKANPTIYAFAKAALKITGNSDDFVLIKDLYRLYREYTNTWKAETRYKFINRIKEMYPDLEYKQKKVNGYPELVFTGCVLANTERARD
jgi:hypothetical protein